MSGAVTADSSVGSRSLHRRKITAANPLSLMAFSTPFRHIVPLCSSNA